MKNLLSLLSLVVLSFSLAGGLLAQNSSTPWTGEAIKWVQGDGTKEDPYLIETPENLAYLSKTLLSEKKTFRGVYFRQTKDLDMNASALPEEKKNFRPIGVFDAYQKTDNSGQTKDFDDSIPFEGVYDGDNHTISNLYVFYDNNENPYASDEDKAKKILTIGGGGLFGFIGPNGALLNLKLSKDCLFVGGGSIASLASYSMGKLFNCHSAATVSAKDMISAGIVSTFLGGSIEHCSFTGEISGTMTMGAICGYLDVPAGINVKGYETTPPVIKNTFARGKIICKGSFSGQAFGFIGSSFTMTNCYVSTELVGGATGNPIFTGRFIGTFDKPIFRDNSKFDNVYVDKTITVAGAEALTAEGDKTINGVIELSSEEMKTDAFIEKLGSEFVKDSKNENDGFPILSPIAVDFGNSYISFKTNKKVGELVGIRMKASGPVELIGLKKTSTTGSYEIADQSFALHGDLTFIDCSSNELIEVDASDAETLKALLCDDNKITKLTLGSSLDTLYCGNNALESLNLSPAVNLLDLSCYGNKLSSIDLSKNVKLKSLVCYENSLTGDLDLSNSPDFRHLDCFSNKIEGIKLAKENKLQYAEIMMNQIKGKKMTEFVNSLPDFVKYPSDEWDDYMGLNLQGLIIVDLTDKEGNIATVTDVEIAKNKKWPVYSLNVGDLGSVAPKEYNGAKESDGIDLINSDNQYIITPTPVRDRAVLNKVANRVQIYSTDGKLILTSSNTSSIDTSSLSNGVYVVLVNGTQSIKMAVNH